MPPATVSKGIEWNKVTWYSKLGAIILFVGVVPALCFYIGTQYELARNAQNFTIPTVSTSSSDFEKKYGPKADPYNFFPTEARDKNTFLESHGFDVSQWHTGKVSPDQLKYAELRWENMPELRVVDFSAKDPEVTIYPISLGATESLIWSNEGGEWPLFGWKDDSIIEIGVFKKGDTEQEPLSRIIQHDIHWEPQTIELKSGTPVNQNNDPK